MTIIDYLTHEASVRKAGEALAREVVQKFAEEGGFDNDAEPLEAVKLRLMRDRGIGYAATTRAIDDLLSTGRI